MSQKAKPASVHFISVATFLLATALCSGFNVQAQTRELSSHPQPAEPVTLETLLKATQDFNAEIRASNAGLEFYREAVNEVKSAYRPQVSLSGGYSFSQREAFLQTGEQFDQFTEPKRLSLAVNQTLFTGGRRRHLKESAQYTVQAEEARHEATIRARQVEVIENYINYLSLERQQDLLLESIEKLKGIETAYLARTKVGSGTKMEVALAKSRVAAGRAQSAVIKAERGLIGARLMSWTGIEIQNPNLPDSVNRPINVNFQDALEKARETDTAIKASMTDEKAAYAQYKSEQKQYLPTVGLEATGNLIEDASPTIARNNDVAIGVIFSKPLYSGGANKARARQALALYNSTRFRTENLRHQSDRRLSELWSQLASSKSVVQAQKLSVEASEEALTGISRAQIVGISTFDDVLDAEDDKLQAELKLLRAEYDLYLARLLIRLQLNELELQ